MHKGGWNGAQPMNKKELRQLSKNQLIDLLFEERQKREALEKRLNEIEAELSTSL
ncbi:MAG: hypothetical protein ACOCP4_02630 [Candidatus Woesearchaeota archaeon]